MLDVTELLDALRVRANAQGQKVMPRRSLLLRRLVRLYGVTSSPNTIDWPTSSAK